MRRDRPERASRVEQALPAAVRVLLLPVPCVAAHGVQRAADLPAGNITGLVSACPEVGQIAVAAWEGMDLIRV